ncbi:MAG TPA: pilus assembly protein PilM [Firmicutes bacterium]|nr:pilus assembly protein PilM [Bacillota bacterium]
MGFGTQKYLGLDIGTEYLKAAELRVRGSRIQVDKVGIKTIGSRANEGNRVNDPAELAENVGHFWQEFGFGTRRVTVAIGGPPVFYRILPLPGLPEAELRRALQWELEDHFPFSAREAVFDLCPLELNNGLGRKQRYYLVVAVPRTFIDGYLTALNLVGLEPLAIEPEPLALLRSWEGLVKVSLLIILKSNYITIGIAARGRLFFARSLPWGFQKIIEGMLAEGVVVEKLTRECRNTLGYFQARTGNDTFTPEEIVVYNGGDGEAVKFILPGLRREFPLPVRIPPPPGGGLSWIPGIPEEKRHFLAVCIGSGLREVRKGGRY